jgi:hypothetical protein
MQAVKSPLSCFASKPNQVASLEILGLRSNSNFIASAKVKFRLVVVVVSVVFFLVVAFFSAEALTDNKNINERINKKYFITML